MRAASASIVAIAAVCMAFYAVRDDRPHPQPLPGQWPEPVQGRCQHDSWPVGDQRITALASYDIKATVLSTERYWADEGSRISPVDFTVGWGSMSDISLARKLDLRQGGRWFRYRLPSASFPVPTNEINSHVANMHLIPSGETVRERLLAVRAGDAVELIGKLVEVEGQKGAKWRSSLSRSDTGAGACELLWVERMDWQ